MLWTLTQFLTFSLLIYGHILTNLWLVRFERFICLYATPCPPQKCTSLHLKTLPIMIHNLQLFYSKRPQKCDADALQLRDLPGCGPVTGLWINALHAVQLGFAGQAGVVGTGRHWQTVRQRRGSPGIVPLVDAVGWRSLAAPANGHVCGDGGW